jgi:hypothetical protein
VPRPKSDFETLYPYRLYTPEELLDPEEMYTVPELARLMQGLDPDTELDEETEALLIEWTIPWLVNNAEDLVINDPVGDEPGYFGLQTEDRDADAAAGEDDDGDYDGEGGTDTAGGDGG